MGSEMCIRDRESCTLRIVALASNQTALLSLQLSLCSNQLAAQLLAFAEGKPCSLHWSSLQVVELHDSSAVEPIASVVLAELSDWVSAESSSAVEPMDLPTVSQ